MADQSTRPVGVRFRPTQQELIYILQFKVQGGDMSTWTNSVVEKNLYGEGTEPWKVFSADDDKWEFYDDAGKNDTRKVLYVITKLSKMSPKKTARTAGCGTWDGQTKPKPFKNYEGNKTVGSMKLLNYLVDPGCEAAAVDKGYWYMHEYSLCEDSLKEIGVPSTDYVICRIIRDHSKSCPVNVSKVGHGKNRKGKTAKGGADHAGRPQVQEQQTDIISHEYGTIESRLIPQSSGGTIDPILMDYQYSITESAGYTDQLHDIPQSCDHTEPSIPQQEHGRLEEMYCIGDQQAIGSEKIPEFDEMYCGGVIAINEEENLQPTDESMAFLAASEVSTIGDDDDWMAEIEKYTVN